MLPICHKDSTLGIEAHVCAKCFLMMDFCLWFENFMNVSVHSYLKLKNYDTLYYVEVLKGLTKTLFSGLLKTTVRI